MRPPISPNRIVEKLGELGAYGVNLHDNDLVPRDASAAERDRIVREFKAALASSGVKVPMATTNLFGDPVFRDGAFTSNDARVRALRAPENHALDRPRRGARRGDVRVLGRTRRRRDERGEGSAGSDEVVSRRAQLPLRVLACRRATSSSSRSSRSRTSRAATSSCRRSATCWRSSTRSIDPDMVGLNPEVAHDTMAGLDFSHGVAQALEAGKLFHIDLNGQKPGRFDQDLRFGSEDLKGAFFLVKLLEDSKWKGMRHFDSHAYRTEDEQGVWDFAARQHAHVSHSQGEGRALQRRRRDSRRCSASSARAARRPAARVKFSADAARELKEQHVRSRRDARAGLRLRAARPADDGTAARSALTWRTPAFSDSTSARAA